MSEWTMKDIRLGLPSVLMLVAVVGAGAFAAGRSLPPPPAPMRTESAPAPGPTEMEFEEGEDLPPAGHLPAGMDLPPGHPSIDSMQGPGAGGGTELPAAGESSLAWTAPARWQAVPNASSMRLATYRVPRADGDAADPELSITQAGGSAEANADRWLGQFDAEARKGAHRSTRKVGAFEVLVVDVRGTFSGGMGSSGPQPGWALLGAIVQTPGMPHFFKLTGPAKSVLMARADFDALIASVRPRGT
jgi:hypothetical protein